MHSIDVNRESPIAMWQVVGSLKLGSVLQIALLWQTFLGDERFNYQETLLSKPLLQFSLTPSIENH
jgi:hypothetical protein